MKRSQIKRRRLPRDSAELRAWKAEQYRCGVCHRPRHLGGVAPHSFHHIVKRSHRLCSEPFNLILLCWACHARAEGETVVVGNQRWGPISMGQIIYAKMREGFYDWPALQGIYRRLLPDPEPLPAAIQQERLRWTN